MARPSLEELETRFVLSHCVPPSTDPPDPAELAAYNEGCSPPPPADEICDNGIDDNGNGSIDESCSPPPPPDEVCDDSIDNDYDGLIDEGCNNPPDAVDDSATTNEDTAVTIGVLSNDSDPDGDPISISGWSNGAHGTVTCSIACTYTPSEDFNGTDSFSYTITDGNGEYDSATVTITTSPVNYPPDAVDDSATTAEDTAVTISVLSNDTDPDGDTLAISGWSDGADGTVVCSTTCTYTPAENFHGSDSFSYTIDGYGGSDTATVTITVNPANDPPDAIDDFATTAEDTPVTISALSNDTDPDGDTLSISGWSDGANGSVVCSSSCTYTPAEDFNGSDSFSYTIDDGYGGTDSATVTITVNPVNDLPDAIDDLTSTAEDTAVTISVLSNDTDRDGDTLTISGWTGGANGTVVCSASCTYTPA